jgi:hypothetical protein
MDLGVHSDPVGTSAIISRQIDCRNQLRERTQNKKEPKMNTLRELHHIPSCCTCNAISPA